MKCDERLISPPFGVGLRRVLFNKTMLKLFLTGLICWWVFVLVPFGKVVDAIHHAALVPIILGLSAYFAMRLIAAGRMTILARIQSLDLAYTDLLALHLKSGFYAWLLPGIVLGSAATWMKYIQAGASTTAALTSVLVNRSVALSVMLSLSLTAYAHETGLTTAAGSFALLAAVMCTVLSILVFFRYPRLISRPLRLIVCLDLRGRFNIAERLRSISDGLAAMRNAGSRRIACIYGLSLLFEFCAVIGMMFLARAFDIDLSLTTLCWLRGAVVLVQLLPVSFLGLGIREVTLIALTADYGVDPASAVGWSLAIFAAGFAMAMLGALLELFAFFRKSTSTKGNDALRAADSALG